MNTARSFHFGTALLLVVVITAAVQAAGPAFVYETTVTGYYLASGRGMAVDDDGNAYVIAYAIGNENDIVVLKLDADGGLLWENYINGNGLDYAVDIVVDAESNVFITGWTDSEDFPVTPGALSETLTGFRDAFVMKLSTSDGSILYSTFLGGDYSDAGYGITLNDAGEIYVVGTTKSTDFPTTPDAYQDHPNFPLYYHSDAFITKLSASGDEILYSTYFGGLTDDTAWRVALDEDENIIIAGETDAEDFPLVDPILSTANDIFISKLSADGSTLQFSTYLGGEDRDLLRGMALDAEGFVYVAGSTRSVGFPTTPGAFQEEFVGAILGCEVPFGADYNCDDVFVTKLATDGSGLVYSTYLGGNTVEECRDIAVDALGRAHVVGYTYSANFPPNGIDFGAENFVSRLDSSGSLLDYTITVDSGSANQGHGIALDSAGGVYITGAIDVPANIYVAKLAGDAIVPDMTVSISSSMTQVARGSDFIYDVQISNNELTPQRFMLWFAMQRLPDGPIHEPLKRPVRVRLGPGRTKIFRNMRQRIGGIPLGAYRFFVRVGQEVPEPVWDEDYWDLEVIP